MQNNDSSFVKLVLDKDAEILIHDASIKKVIELKENDILLGLPTNNTILKVYKSTENLYRIITRYGNSFIIGEHTQFLTFNNIKNIYQQINIKLFSELNNEEKQYISIHKISINYDEKKVDIEPYLVGILLGNTDKIFIKIRLENKNGFLKSKMIEVLRQLKLKYFHTDVDIIIFISSSHIDNDILKKYNFIFEKKYIPANYKYNSLNIRNQLIAGIIDINSNLNYLKNSIDIINLDKDLAIDIYNLFFSIGLYQVVLVKNNSLYNIEIYNNLNSIQLHLKYYPPKESILCNNFKIAPIKNKDCVVLEFNNISSSIILSDLTIV